MIKEAVSDKPNWPRLARDRRGKGEPEVVPGQDEAA